jgi:hypothetical protein
MAFNTESHSYPTYSQRKKSKLKESGGLKFENWLKVDKIVDEVYVDLVNGLTKSDIIQKLQEGLYTLQKGKGVKPRTGIEYINAAQQRLAFDFEKDAEKLRADLYSKMMAVYADCMAANDRYNALNALDKLMKLTGVANDKPSTAIQINSDKEGGVTVNFGFDKKEDEN